jgi:ABC-2 type transport system permease protein
MAWVGAGSHSGVGFGRALVAGLNAVPAALLLLGVGTLVHATLPRLAAAAIYALIGWAFLIQFVGSVVKMSHWVLDTSVFFHVAPAPATDPNWAGAAGLVGLGLACFLLGGYMFSRRDLASA